MRPRTREVAFKTLRLCVWGGGLAHRRSKFGHMHFACLLLTSQKYLNNIQHMRSPLSDYPIEPVYKSL